MTKKTRRRFTPEYKEQAVARLLEPGVTYASLSAELGITSGQLKTRHLELLVAGSATAIAQTKSEATELAQLRRDVKRLKEENEVMRKASIFSLSGRRRHEHQAHVHSLAGRALRSNVACRDAPGVASGFFDFGNSTAAEFLRVSSLWLRPSTSRALMVSSRNRPKTRGRSTSYSGHYWFSHS